MEEFRDTAYYAKFGNRTAISALAVIQVQADAKFRAIHDGKQILILLWVSKQFAQDLRLQITPTLPSNGGPLFKSDAKAEAGRATIGGWFCGNGTKPKDAPCSLSNSLSKHHRGCLQRQETLKELLLRWNFWGACYVWFYSTSRRPVLAELSKPSPAAQTIWGILSLSKNT